jgi:chromosomal replication initiation ATPase DnaA
MVVQFFYVFLYIIKTIMREVKEVDLLQNLLKNIQQALKKFTIKELNDYINNFMHDRQPKTTEIDFIFEIVCLDFKTTKSALLKPHIRGELNEAKQMIYCLLYFELGLPTRYIAAKIFDSWHNSVFSGIKKFRALDPKLKQDKEFLDKYELLLNKFKNNFENK